MGMKVGVVGAGLFGCQIAIDLTDAGHEIEIIEKSNRIMSGATQCNQQRLHRGYHYPRSFETAMECKQGADEFDELYPGVAYRGVNRLYAIAKKGSQTSADAYIHFLDQVGLEWAEFPGSGIVNVDEVEAIFQVEEESIDPVRLTYFIAKGIRERGIKLRLGEAASAKLMDEFDHIVVAAYAGNNDVLRSLGVVDHRRVAWLQYELVEKPVLQMPRSWPYRASVVIMDGEFCSVDPAGRNPGLSLMGHVHHAVLQRDITQKFIPRAQYTGLHGTTKSVRWKDMQKAGSRFIPALADAKWLSSYYVTRAVRPYRDATDERLTSVERITPNVTQVFSGKLPAVTFASREVTAILERKDGCEGLRKSNQDEQVAV